MSAFFPGGLSAFPFELRNVHCIGIFKYLWHIRSVTANVLATSFGAEIMFGWRAAQGYKTSLPRSTPASCLPFATLTLKTRGATWHQDRPKGLYYFFLSAMVLLTFVNFFTPFIACFHEEKRRLFSAAQKIGENRKIMTEWGVLLHGFPPPPSNSIAKFSLHPLMENEELVAFFNLVDAMRISAPQAAACLINERATAGIKQQGW